MGRPTIIRAGAAAAVLALGLAAPASAITEGNGTDARATTVSISGTDVTVATVAPDGSGHATVTSYVDRDQAVAATSRAQRAGATLAAADPSRCAPYYGTASTACTGKWSYGAYNDPKVCAEDYTGSTWPVTDARLDWYQAPGIDLYYHYRDGCSSAYHPVWVYEGNFGTLWYGQTSYVWTDATDVYRKSATISLNNQVTPNTYAARRKVACHELGHALGVGHNTSTASCMVNGASFATAQHPSSQDFTILSKLYPKPGT